MPARFVATSARATLNDRWVDQIDSSGTNWARRAAFVYAGRKLAPTVSMVRFARWWQHREMAHFVMALA
jgi:hypothetical protein